MAAAAAAVVVAAAAVVVARVVVVVVAVAVEATRAMRRRVLAAAVATAASVEVKHLLAPAQDNNSHVLPARIKHRAHALKRAATADLPCRVRHPRNVEHAR